MTKKRGSNELRIQTGQTGLRIDVLRFLAMPDESMQAKCSRQRNAKGHFKGDAGDIITEIDPESGVGQWKHVKNPQGWPWDLKLYDNDFVYDWITEGKDGWSSNPEIGPKSYKKFIQNHVSLDGDLADGLAMFPRFIDSVENNSVLKIPSDQTLYATFSNCEQVGEPCSLGDVTQKLQGPFLINHGGDIGACSTLIHQYYWTDNGVPVLEENYYALDYGWTAWKLQRQNSSTGFYELVNETTEVLIFPVDEVKVVFPCF
jgi:hypothetical protein